MSERDWSAELTAYIDGELSAEDAKGVEAALARDPALQALEAQLRRTVEAVEGLGAPEPSQALRRGVLNNLSAPAGLGERLSAWLRPARLVPAGVVAAAAIVGLVMLSSRSDPLRPRDEESLFLAQNMEVVEDLDLMGLDTPEDLEVVASLDELEVQR